MRRLGNPDSLSRDDGSLSFGEIRHCAVGGDKELRVCCAQTRAVQPSVDAQRRAQLSRTARQFVPGFDASILPHEFLACDRRNRSDEHGFSRSWCAADRVDAEMITVNEIDVGPSGRPPHRPVSLSLAVVRMTSWVISQVGFSFDDRPPARPGGGIPHEPVTEQPRGNELGRRKEETFRQRRVHERHQDLDGGIPCASALREVLARRTAALARNVFENEMSMSILRLRLSSKTMKHFKS